MLMAVASSGGASYDPLVYVLGALVMGGALPLLYQMLLRWRRGPIEDRHIVSSYLHEEVASLKDLLAEYRQEVELTKRQLEDYRVQLGELTRELARAQVRIAMMEAQLERAVANREELQRELAKLKLERDHLTAERQQLAAEVVSQRERVEKLEAMVAVAERLAQPPAAD